MVGRTLLAALFGAFVGWERENHGQDAGMRTYAAVALGACTFGLISTHATNQIDTRIAAHVVSGIGFLGAGLIMREQGRATGLTTAATLWSTAAVGLAMAFGMYTVSILTLTLYRCIPGSYSSSAKTARGVIVSILDFSIGPLSMLLTIGVLHGNSEEPA